MIKLTSMGDVIHTFPALTDAQKYIDGIQFDFVVEESFQEIPAWHQTVNRVIPVATRRWRKNLLTSKGQISSAIKTLREQHYDAIIDAQGLIKSAVIASFAKGVRHGYDAHSIREPLASKLYKKVYSISPSLHAITRIRYLFAHSLGYEQQLSEGMLEEKGNSLDYGLTTNRISPEDQNSKLLDAPFIVLLHGTTWLAKEWPTKNWQQLAEKLSSNHRVLLPWGNDREYQRAIEISQNNPNIEVLPKFTLSSLAHVLDKAEGVVAVDTGLGHLSAALSKPTVSIYGPTDTQLVGTLGQNQCHLRASDEPNWRGIKKNEIFDYDKVSVQSVYEELLNLLRMNTSRKAK